jgi:hypothetical protein
MISAQVLITQSCLSTIDWLKLKPFKLNAVILTLKEVNQIPRIDHNLIYNNYIFKL